MTASNGTCRAVVFDLWNTIAVWPEDLWAETRPQVAAHLGLTVEELCNANKATIKDCDKLGIGDELVIPAAAPQEFTDTPAPSSS